MVIFDAPRPNNIGEWMDDKRHGKGVMKWVDGRIYNGKWMDDSAKAKV